MQKNQFKRVIHLGIGLHRPHLYVFDLLKSTSLKDSFVQESVCTSRAVDF